MTKADTKGGCCGGHGGGEREWRGGLLSFAVTTPLLYLLSHVSKGMVSSDMKVPVQTQKNYVRWELAADSSI